MANNRPQAAKDGRHYWLSPDWLLEWAAWQLGVPREQVFDPCPYPRPLDFNGLVAEWGYANYLNPLFVPHYEVMDETVKKVKKVAITAWVRKALIERGKGKSTLIVYPIDGWLHLLLKDHAEIISVGNVYWRAIEDESVSQCSRPIMAFLIQPASHRDPSPPGLRLWASTAHQETFPRLRTIRKQLPAR
jgi:hypothetical protein